MNFNYLRMNWDVKIYLAKIKDGKGKDFKFPAKKSLLTTIRPKNSYPMVFIPSTDLITGLDFLHGMEGNDPGISPF